jgi:hypothetical protein
MLILKISCAQSVTMQIGARKDNEYNQMQNVVVIDALNQGWFVSVADDQGPQSSFGKYLFQISIGTSTYIIKI